MEAISGIVIFSLHWSFPLRMSSASWVCLSLLVLSELDQRHLGALFQAVAVIVKIVVF